MGNYKSGKRFLKILLTAAMAAGLCLQAVPASFASELIPEDADMEYSADIQQSDSDDLNSVETVQEALYTDNIVITTDDTASLDASDPSGELFEETDTDLTELFASEEEEIVDALSPEDSLEEVLWEIPDDEEIAGDSASEEEADLSEEISDYGTDIIPDDTIPDEAVPDETIPGETVPDETIPDEEIPEEDEFTLEVPPLASEDTLTVNAWDRIDQNWGPIILFEGYQYPTNERELQLSRTSSNTTAASIEWQKRQSDNTWKKDETGRFSAGTWRCVLALNGAGAIHENNTGMGRIDFQGFPSGTTWQGDVHTYSGNFTYTSTQFTVKQGEKISKVRLSLSSPCTPEVFNTVPDLSGMTFADSDTSSSKGVTFEAYWAKYPPGKKWYQSTRISSGDTFSIGEYFLIIKLKCSKLEYSFTDSSNSLTEVLLNGKQLFYNDLLSDGTLMIGRNYTLTAEKDGLIYEAAYEDQNSLAVTGRKSDVTDPHLEIPGQVTFGSRTFTVSEISYGAFDCDDSIETVQVPASVAIVDQCAFESCSNLREVTFASNSELKKIGTECFYGCTNLKKIDLPFMLESIYDDAFAYCGLTDVVFPASLKMIGSGAFRYCTSLTSIVFSAGSSLEVIGESAFTDCTSLTSQVVFPASLQWLNERAFCNCEALSDVMFEKGSSLASIGESALGDTTHLQSLCITYYDDDTSAKEEVENFISNYMLVNPGDTHITSRALKDTAKCKIAAIPDRTYSGGAITPALTVTYGPNSLKPGTDFTASWTNNTNTGTAMLTITGKGDYYGTLKKAAFRIVPASIAAAVVADIADQAYTGKELKPSPVVTLSGKTLKAGKDYTLSYKDNKAAGIAALTVTGKDNYVGTVSKSFRIFNESTAYPADKVSPENPAVLNTVTESITNKKDETDVGGSTFSLLQARGTAKSSTKIRLKWNKVPGAAKYIIYGNKCGKKNRYKELASVRKTSWVQKKLKKGTYYKYLIVAVNGNKVLASSKTIHVATKGGTRGNNKSVLIKKGSKKITKLTLKPGKKAALKAAAKAESSSAKVKKHRKISWESSDVRVATVSSSGKVIAVGKGTCYVYAYAQNGVTAKIKVTVK